MQATQPILIRPTLTNREAWNACVLAATPDLPFGLADWLEAVAPGRVKALAWPDEKGGFAALYPFVEYRKALLLPYATQPPYTQQLGLFARRGFDGIAAARSIKAALRFRLFRRDLVLADEALAKALSPRAEQSRSAYLTLRDGFALDLAKGGRHNLKLAGAAGLTIEPILPAEAFQIAHQALEAKLGTLASRYAYAQVRLCALTSPHYQLSGLGARLGDTLVAAAVFVHMPGRTIYLAAGSGPEGYGAGAPTALLVQAITRAERGQVFDFEGGAMAGTGAFFSLFRPEWQMLWRVRI